VVKPAAKRLIANYFMDTYKMKERQACRLINLALSSKRYDHKAETKADNQNIKQQLITLAQKHVRYGYRRLNACLNNAGLSINHKKTYRLYKEANLKYAQKKYQKVKYVKSSSLPKATMVNQIWSMDFISDKLTDKRKFRCLNIIDTYSRFNMAIEAASSLPALRVITILEQAIEQYGSPQSITIDNGPEFRSKAFCKWAERRHIKLNFIDPGKPTQNAYVESFNGKFRDECLNQHWFSSMQEAIAVIKEWRENYNNFRPDSSLKYSSPSAFVAKNMIIPANTACQNQELNLV